MIMAKLQDKIDRELREKVSIKVALSEAAVDPEYTNEKLIAKYSSFCEQQSSILHDRYGLI